uniref:Uncharacterized protein n=1 Tax=Rhizophora mucronata TaxID=61149 RepID=A0A2P2JGX5_RHIMU
MAGLPSLSLSLAADCANISVMQKMQWSAQSIKCFLKPNTYPVCRRTALEMTGEKVLITIDPNSSCFMSKS